MIAKPAALRRYVKRIVDLGSAGHHIRARLHDLNKTFRDKPKADPLIFFVHVPKTAGSTVSSHLHDFLPNGLSHCESFFYDQERVNKASNFSDWLSGHIDLTTAEKTLGQSTNRTVRYFACMRNPTQHVMSHYNWVIEIFYRGGPYYENAPKKIREMCDVLRASPTDPASIAANLERYSYLFLNAQSRYILGHTFDWNSGILRERLSRYEMIVDSSGLSALLDCMLGHAITDGRKENVSPYHFDPAVFETAALKKFLKKRNALDDTLYRTLGLTQG